MRRGAALAGAFCAGAAGVLGCAGPERPRSDAGLTAEPALVAVPIDSEEAWVFDGREGRIVQTPHYRVYTTRGRDALVARLPLFLETALLHYRTAATPGAPLPEPRVRLETFVLETRGEWERLTRQLLGERADPFLRIRRGGYAWGGRSVLFDLGGLGDADTLLITAHEGWHQYTQRAFARPLPVWLEEGMATYVEGHRWRQTPAGLAPVFMPWANPARFDELRRAAEDGRLMPLETVLTAAPAGLLSAPENSDAVAYYAHVWALMHFLREGEGGRYAPALARLLAGSANGEPPPAADRPGLPEALRRNGAAVFIAAIDADLESASEAYRRFVLEAVRPGARGAIVEGRSPLDARAR